MTDQKPRSIYSPAERCMIMCMTRERTCTPEMCLTKNACWMREEVRDEWIKLQAEYEANRSES
jgi:hypothetical protein